MDYAINNDRVLIVPGYRDDEILQQSAKNGAQVAQPTSLFFACGNVHYTPHIKSYEEFNSAEGLIMMEKACDQFAEVSMDINVHQQISNQKGRILIDKETREARLRVNDNSIVVDDKDNPDQMYLSRWVSPEEFTEEYLQVRDAFFEDLYGRPLTIVSPLFPAIPVAYLVNADYSIDNGSEEAVYNVTFKETESIGI